MAIFKNKQKTEFVMIPNELVADERISWKSKGVLCYLLSMPYDWKIYTEEIAKHSTDGIDSLNSSIKELISFGYIERVKLRGEKGKFGGYEYSVYEVPTVTDLSKNGETKNGLSKNGKSKATNTNLTKKNLTKKDVTKKELHHLSPNDDTFIAFYLGIMKEYGKKDKGLSDENYNYILTEISELKDGVDLETWKEQVLEHFENLPEGNDGDILPFLKASRRFFG